MNFTDFFVGLAAQIEGKLEKIGFEKQVNDLYVRFNENHDINVIFIQKHSSDSSVSLNFGVHYDFLPKIASIELPSKGTIELPDCEFKYRVTPSIADGDHWWPLSESAIDEVAELILSRANDYFSDYDINSSIGNLTTSDLDGEFPALFKGVTKVRACLVLASINEVKNNHKLAADFAKIGIKAAGMAVGPKKLLKQVLKRVES